MITAGDTLSAGQAIGPLIFNGGDSIITLPSAQTLLDVYGTNHQVQIGDYFILQVYNLSGSGATFAPGSGGTGGGTITLGAGFIAITFTNTTLGSTAYSFIVNTD